MATEETDRPEDVRSIVGVLLQHGDTAVTTAWQGEGERLAGTGISREFSGES